MKKYFAIALSILTMFTLLLTGCGKQNETAQTPPTSQSEVSEPVTPDGGEPQGDSLMTVVEMLGKSDAEVEDYFGGGTENRTEDGSVLLGRSYSTNIDENAVTLETVYADDGTVSSVSASFTDRTPEEVKEIMTNAFGEPETTDETQSMDSKYVTWTTDSALIVMNESYGMSMVEFTLAGI